jgi:predicted permease
VEPRKQPQIGAIIVSPSYFPAMEIRPRRGRVLLETDRAGGVPVALVNETLARIAWPGEEPVGRRLRLTRSSGASAAPQPWLTVVGVIPDIVQNDESQGAHDPLVYLPYSQSQVRDMIVFARTLVPPETLSNAFRRAVQSVDEDLPVVDLRTLDRLLWERTRSWRVYGGMFSIFAAMALLMASVGIYAVIAYSVNQRTQEIGIRRAMGASTWCILGMVFTQGMRPLLAGLALGIAVSFGVTRFLSAFLVGVEPGDPLTLATVGVVLILSGALGSAIPARRAIQVDPIEALKYE